MTQRTASILLHTCCGPCLLGVAPHLSDRGYRVHAYFNNPNIHGLIEFRRRLGAFLQAVDILKLPETHESAYGLELFMAMWTNHRTDRCRGCYRMRLEPAAAEARRLGIPHMTTTLLISPHQDRAVVIEEGRRAAHAEGVEFVEDDFRDLHEAAVAEAKRHSLYRQQYCGCIFSEEARYRNTRKHLPRRG